MKIAQISRDRFLLWLLASARSLGASSGSVPEIDANHRVFADSLTSGLYSDDNECSSALGVSMAFSLVYPSTTGESSSQIRSVFGYPEGSQSQLVWGDTASRLDSAYEGDCLNSVGNGGDCYVRAPTLEIANSVWVDTGSNLNTEYSSIVGSYLRQIDFQDTSAGGQINAWVDDATRGLIDSIVPDGSISASLVAVNSIYLKASWVQPFAAEHTSEDTFYTSVSRTTAQPDKTHFMHKVDYFMYSHHAMPGYQMLQLEFTGRDLSMIFVLPSREDSGEVSSSRVLAALPELQRVRVAVALPKVKFESTYDVTLMSSLQALDLTAPFLGGLCVFQDDCTTYVSSVIQKTFLSVDENGVEAAAVSAIIARTGMPVEQPVLFQADHPFQFFIYDQKEDLVIFEGRVGAPEIPAESTAPLQASHSSSTFWSDNFWVEPEDPKLGTDDGGTVIDDDPGTLATPDGTVPLPPTGPPSSSLVESPGSSSSTSTRSSSIFFGFLAAFAVFVQMFLSF